MALQTRNHFGAMATEPREDREDAVSMARRRLIRRETRLRAEVREAGVKDERRFERVLRTATSESGGLGGSFVRLGQRG
jgi:hypothetical protein